jgi:hypothetical protein
MRAITQNQRGFSIPLRIPPLGMGASADLSIVCLWSALGLTLTGLLFALGPGAEIGQILAMAGWWPRSCFQRGKRVTFVRAMSAVDSSDHDAEGRACSRSPD